MRANKIKHDKITDELGNTIEIKMWSVPPTPDKPDGYKYSLVYIVNGQRVLGYDNAEGKGITVIEENWKKPINLVV